jgi:hypothetical protein
MEFTSLNEGHDFLTYPANKVLGVLSTPEELHAAVTELNNTGFNKEQVQVLCGEKGRSVWIQPANGTAFWQDFIGSSKSSAIWSRSI